MSSVPPPPPPPPAGGFPPAPGFPGQPQYPQPGAAPPTAYTPAPYGAPPGAPQQYGAPAYGTPPPGYAPYGGWTPAGRVESSKGLRVATILAFWLVTIASAVVSLALFHRKSVWDDAQRAGFSFQYFSKIDDADTAAGGALLFLWAAELFAVIMVALWAGRIARNAIARGATGISSGMAVGGWFIPIGCYWLGFGQLAKSVRGVSGQAPTLRAWQIAFIIAQLGSGVLFAIRRDLSLFDDPDDVAAFLNRQGVVSLVSAALFLVATILAMRATKQVDEAVTGTA